jgi:hypothetical protein
MEPGIAALRRWRANDHFVFSTPWLDGPTVLASVVGRSGAMDIATTVSPVALRGPVALAKTLAALDILSGGRLIAGLGPGSSKRDYHALGLLFEDRWRRFDEASRACGRYSVEVRAAAALMCVGSPQHCLESCPGTGTRAASAWTCGRWETSDAARAGRERNRPGARVSLTFGREHRLPAESASVDAQRSIY